MQNYIALAKKDLFILPTITNKGYEPLWHLKPFINILQEIVDGRKRKFTIHVPPQHGKSESILHAIALLLRNNPTKRIAYISYAQKFSERQVRKAKKYAKFLGLNFEIENQKESVLVDGGGILTSSITGELTGDSVDWLIVDDPFASPMQAQSKAYRERVWDWFLGVALDRVRPETSLTVVHTRWHLDDLIGRIQKSEYKNEMQHLRLPALYDGLDAFGKPLKILEKPIDTPLWRDREFYETKKKVNKNVFLAKYQGLPIIKGDAVFKDVTFYSKLPENYKVQIGVDLAYTKSTKADYSVIVVMYVSENKYYIKEVLRFREEIDRTKSILENVYNKYKVQIGIEANGAQKAVYDYISKSIGMSRFYKLQPTADKYTRAIEFSSAWNIGDVLCPDPAIFPNNWLEDFLDEVQSFTGVNDRHDDQVDAANWAFKAKRKLANILSF